MAVTAPKLSPFRLNLPLPNLPTQAKMQRPPLIILGLALLVVAGTLLPLSYLLIRASNAGLDKVMQIMLRARTHEILLNSVSLAASVTIATTLIGVTLAWLTVRTDLPWRKIWAVLTALPLVIPSYIGAYTFISAFGPRGELQQLLTIVGIDRLPELYGFPGAFVVMTLFTYPYILLSVRASLRGLDPSLEEAARSLGRSSFQTFRDVTLPHLRPSIIAGSLLVAFYTLSDFGAVSMMRFDTFTRAIYVQYTTSFDRSVAAILALLLVGLTIIVLIAEQKVRGRAKYYRSSNGTVRPSPPVKLGLWTVPAVIFCSLIVLLGLIIPVGIIAYWLLRGWLAGEALNFEWLIIQQSVVASGVAALIAVVAAVPVSVMAIRYPSRTSRWIERSTYLSYALPGVVIALSLVFFGANYATLLYQTLAMLIFAYVVRFLPQAIGSTRASLLQVSPRLEEASRNLGCTPFQTVIQVTLPLMRSGLMTGMALVFLTAMKELPATLLLGPTGFKTLAVATWGAVGEAFFAEAAAPALVLVFVSAISVWLILSQEEKMR